jgi:hypothetical protein
MFDIAPLAKAVSELGLKARNMIAQGNALGNRHARNQALKGRNIFARNQ